MQENWAATERWSLKHLSEQYGELPVLCKFRAPILPHETLSDVPVLETSLGAYISYCEELHAHDAECVASEASAIPR